MSSLEFVLVFSFCIAFFSIVIFSYLDYVSISTFLVKQNYFSLVSALNVSLFDLQTLNYSATDFNRGANFD